ncbi:MAG: LemA family protein [Deltaproteobacteria bacterium]|nr:LemA family protein [Deltaproteobacteria bacterium]
MTKNKKITLCVIGGLILLFLIFTSFIKNTYNNMVMFEENVKEKWSQVENVYQRRFDLIPNLVETVKGYAAHENKTFENITQARAKVGGVFNISEKVLNDPAMFQKFQEAQNSLGGALQRLMAVTENYPNLKANQNFLALQNQLEGTENRITVERRRFNESAKHYNIYIKQFPRAFMARMFNFSEKPYFKSVQEAQTAPKVEF